MTRKFQSVPISTAKEKPIHASHQQHNLPAHVGGSLQAESTWNVEMMEVLHHVLGLGVGSILFGEPVFLTHGPFHRTEQYK